MNIKVRSLFCLVSIFAFLDIYAQNGKISGVVSYNGLAIENSVISIHSISKSVSSDSVGSFVINGLSDGTYTLHIKSLGHFDDVKNVKVSNGNETKIQINLSPNIIQLNDFNVSSNRLKPNNIIGNLDLQLRPISSSQDLLRLVPGLFIAQHAGGGKSEQIFLRGFDVDHGTDFAIYVDGIPVNMPSHAHGQGYADLHFLIPETVQELEVNKGPHTTKYGDLATAGSGEFRTLNSLNRNMVKLEYGMFGTKRFLGMFNLLGNKHLFSKNKESFYVATEFRHTNSYFQAKQNFYRTNIFSKYTGELNNGDKLTISISTFQSQWDASGQIPDRKVEDGSLSRFGGIDTTEGGVTGRSNFNIIHERNWKNSSLKNHFFYSRYDFNLFSNFTFFLNDSVNGDQINQIDHRNIFGYNSTFQMYNKLADKELSSTFSAGVRYDNSSISLDNTVRREFLNKKVSGKLNQINAWVYADENYQITKKLKANLGVRADVYNFDFQNYINDTASGNERKGIVSPKLNLSYAANNNIQLFAKSGFGFHSNDARAVVVGKLDNTLARAFGNEVGATFKPFKRLITNVAFWTLDLQSELVYVGDEGIVEAAGRTRRVGVDFGARYQIGKYLFLDADINLNKGKLRDEPSNANNIPLAPTFTSIGGITYKKTDGLNGSLRYRYMGDRAAIEDNSIVAKGYFLMDLVVNYNYKKFQFGISVENVLDTKWKEAQFATESKLKGESEPVNEIHYTPGTPLFIKGSFAYFF